MEIATGFDELSQDGKDKRKNRAICPPLPRDFIAWEYKEGRFWRLVDGLPHDEIVRQREE